MAWARPTRCWAWTRTATRTPRGSRGLGKGPTPANTGSNGTRWGRVPPFPTVSPDTAAARVSHVAPPVWGPRDTLLRRRARSTALDHGPGRPPGSPTPPPGGPCWRSPGMASHGLLDPLKVEDG